MMSVGEQAMPPKVAYSINCSLCGCNGASVRCEKCNSMAFCIGCDDMYHRHPKRRNHLRQAVALEFLQALEKHNNAQAEAAQQRAISVKSPLPASNHSQQQSSAPVVDNQSLYPWRRPRTMPRMPENFDRIQPLSLAARGSSSPSPTPHQQVQQQQQQQQKASIHSAYWTQPLPLQQHQQQHQPLMMVHHPSKMPVPPPRRKRRGLSFSGLKDTFRRIVNPGGYHKHQQQQLPQTPEPIYATIIRPAPKQQQQQQPVHQKTVMANGARQLNGGNSNSLPRNATPTTATAAAAAAFRPLPALPPEPQDERELIYENTRKHSLPVGGAFTDYQRQKQQQQELPAQPAPFASSFDLREYENFVRANGGGGGTFDPRRTSMEQLPMMASAEVRSSTMPFRRNFSCADITTGVTGTAGNGPHRCINSLLHQQQLQQLPLFSPVSSKAPSPMPWAANSSQQCLNCTSLAALHHQQHQHHQQQLMMMGHHHGSTQSLYPGFGSSGTGSGLFSPNIFSGGGSGCCTPSIINGSVCGSGGQQHWCTNNNSHSCGGHCGRGIHPLTSSTSGHHSLASSMEELNHHHSHPHHPHHHNHHSNHQHRNNNSNHRHNSSASLKGGRSFEDDDFEDERDDLLSEDEEYEEEEEEEDGGVEVSRRMMAKAATRGHHRKNGGNSQSSTTTASSSSSSRTKATKDLSVFSPSLYQVPSGHPGGKQQNGRKISSSSSSTSSSVARTYKKQQPTTTTIPTVPADVLRRSQRSHQAEDKRAAEDQQENDEEEEEKEVVNEQGQWSCRFCTFFNDPQKNICDICAKTRRHLRPASTVTVQKQQQQQQQSSPKISSSGKPIPSAVQEPAPPMPSLANSKSLDHYGSPGPRVLPSTISSSSTVPQQQQQQQKPVPTTPVSNSTTNDSKIAEVPKTTTTTAAAAAQTEPEKPKQQQQQKLQQPQQQQPQIQPQQQPQQPQEQHCIKNEVISTENDNDLLRRRSSSISSTQTDVAEEEVENSMDQDYLYFQRAADPRQQQLRNHLKSSSQHQQQQPKSSSELLDFYIRKLSLADPSSSASPSSSSTSTTVATASTVSGNQSSSFDHHQMEALIGSWRYEKAMLDAEREQLRWAEKERRQMAKMIDLHRRIGGGRGGSGYLSDGTTTEEELDREVEQVFRAADTAELRAKLAGIEDDDVDNDGDDDETAAEELPSAAAAAVALLSDASTTPDADLFTGPLPSKAAAPSSSTSASTSAASTTFPSSPPSKRAPSPVALAAQHLSTPAVCTSVSLALSEALPDNRNLLPQSTSSPVAIPLSRQIQQQQQQQQESARIATFEQQQQQQVLDLTSIEITPPEEEEEEEAVEYPPVDIRRWSRPLEDDVDFEWARTEFECELCTATVPVQDIVSMISCTHTACRDCLKAYFTVQIRERQRLVITCPFCEQPAIGADEDELVFEYLGLFDPMLRHLVEPEVYELWQHKLRDRALMRDPNFLWCTQCSSGFITPNPLALTVMCPDCRQLTCQKCKRPWKKQHFNISCAAYAQWEVDNDPSFAEQQLNKHLKEFGIECPNCKFRYQLAKGGCMHFRCLQCGYDFCGGCSRPFKLGNRCFRARMCAALGLHAHHPRNCLFYLRDKEIADLKALLNEHQVPYRTELEGDQTVTRCAVMEQKETDSGMKDEPCNRFVESAGLCKLHYKEYLGTLIYQHCIDPISIFSEVELELVLRRENIRIPNQKVRNMASMQRAKEVFSRLENGGNSSTSTSSSAAEDDEKYRKMLVELILEKVPLDLWE